MMHSHCQFYLVSNDVKLGWIYRRDYRLINIGTRPISVANIYWISGLALFK